MRASHRAVPRTSRDQTSRTFFRHGALVGKPRCDWRIFSSQKPVDFPGEESVTAACRDKGRLAPIGILPRWRGRHCGASAVTAPGAVATGKDPQNVASQSPRKDHVGPRREARKRACKALGGDCRATRMTAIAAISKQLSTAYWSDASICQTAILRQVQNSITSYAGSNGAHEAAGPDKAAPTPTRLPTIKPMARTAPIIRGT